MRNSIVWLLFGLSVVLAGAGLALWALTRSIEVSTLPRIADPALMVAFLAYAAVGSLIVSRRFGNRVGWIFVAAGVGFEFVFFCQEYAIYALRKSPGTLPGGSWAGLVADLAATAALGLGIFLPLLFPTGHLLSRRWRVVAWLGAASLLVMAVGIAVKPGTLETITGAEKPVEVDFPLFTYSDWAWPAAILALLLALVSMFVRYRTSGPVERQQLRWFLAAAPIFIVSFFLIGSFTDALSVVGALGLASLPIAAGIAIFRYHLYDLDVVVRRTLVYGVLTAGLAGLYFGIVIALQQIFSGFTRGNDLAIAGSTLAVAALFRPVRRRIQAFVDRRFYRRRYNAEQTLDAFSARLRDEVNLDELAADLAAAVRETMQPSHVSVWLRDSGTTLREPRQDTTDNP